MYEEANLGQYHCHEMMDVIIKQGSKRTSIEQRPRDVVKGSSQATFLRVVSLERPDRSVEGRVRDEK